MDSELLASFIILQKQRINKTDKMSIIKLKKLVTLLLLKKTRKKNKIKRKYWVHPIFSDKKRERYGAQVQLL